MTKEKMIAVSKETDEVMEAFVGIAKATKQALADGFQVGQDIPAVVAASWSLLPGAIQGMDQVGAEFSENRKAFLMACAAGAMELADALFPQAPKV